MPRPTKPVLASPVPAAAVLGQITEEAHESLCNEDSSLRDLEKKTRKVHWSERANARLDRMGVKLDEKMPPNKVQLALDQFGRKIEKMLRPKKLLDWLNKSSGSNWFTKAADFLLKLPLRAVKNVLSLVYGVFKGIAYGFVHPIKAVLAFSKFVVAIADTLSSPSSWAQIGAGMIGASLGTSLVLGNPVGLIGLAIGGAVLLLGLTGAAIKTAVTSEKGERASAVGKELKGIALHLPEAMLTGFLIGCIAGGIKGATGGGGGGAEKPLSPTMAVDIVDDAMVNANCSTTGPDSPARPAGGLEHPST